MATQNEIHLNDLGTDFIVTIVDLDNAGAAIDISSATAREIIFLKADGTKDTHIASFVTDGTDGQIHYIGQAGDLDQTGTYKIQGIVTTPAGKWYSTIDKFKVIGNL